MVRERPTILLVMGILNMVFGGLGLLCGICGLGLNLMAQGMGSMNIQDPQGGGNPVKEMLKFIEKEIPGYQAIELSAHVLVMILAIVMVVAGIGLFLCKGWGRWLSVACALLTILVNLGYVGFEIGLVYPAMEKYEKKISMQPGGRPTVRNSPDQSCGKGGLIGRGILFSLYSVTLLITMFLPVVGEACSGYPVRKRRSIMEDDYDDRTDRGRDDDRDRDRDDDDEGRFRRRVDRDD